MRPRDAQLGIFAFRNIRYIFQQTYNRQNRSLFELTNPKSALRDNMIKITPLSGLVKGNDKVAADISKDVEDTLLASPGRDRNTMITKTTGHGTAHRPDSLTDEGVFCSPEPEKSCSSSKRSVIPNELLSKVTQTVKGQVEDGTFAAHSSTVDQSECFGEREVCAEYSANPEILKTDSEENVLLEPGSSSDTEKWERVQGKAAKKSAKKRKKDILNEGGDEDCEEKGDKKKTKKIMPNYFIAVQITDRNVHEGLREVQQKVEEQKPSLAAAMIPLPTLHITLLVMHLSNEEEIEKAKTILTHCGRKIENIQESPITLDISGIGHFGNSVVFAKVNKGPHLDGLHNVADIVVKVFRENEINLAGEKGFKPHITVMKLSRSPKLRKKGIKKIDSKYYNDYIDKVFGSQTIQSLQLCSMLGPKDKNGYYEVLHSVPLCRAKENVFTADIEDEVMWNYTPGPVPEPLEPTEEVQRNLLSSIRSSLKIDNPNLDSKTQVSKRTIAPGGVAHKETLSLGATKAKKDT